MRFEIFVGVGYVGILEDSFLVNCYKMCLDFEVGISMVCGRIERRFVWLEGNK